MRYSKYVLMTIGALLSLRASTALGQRGAAAAWGFVNAQYNTRSSSYIYTGYGWRGAFAMAGVVNNPRSGYAELLGGVGGVFKTGTGAEHWLAVATAKAGAVSFAQIYWLPRVQIGAVTSRATVKWRVPYAESEAQKFTIAPLSVTLPLTRRLAGGVAGELTAAEGARTSIGTGPELRLRIPGAAVGVDALRDVKGSGSSVRLFFSSTF